MCEMCKANEDDTPTPTRPLNRYDMMGWAVGTVHAVTYVLTESLEALHSLLVWQSKVMDHHAKLRESFARDLETLETNNG